MFSSLADLATRRGKLVVVLAAVFFATAGALGAGVADRLDPYGADDPDTESVIATERLEDAGYRPTSVVVLINDVDATSPAGQSRIAEVIDHHEKELLAGWIDCQLQSVASRRDLIDEAELRDQSRAFLRALRDAMASGSDDIESGAPWATTRERLGSISATRPSSLYASRRMMRSSNTTRCLGPASPGRRRRPGRRADDPASR